MEQSSEKKNVLKPEKEQKLNRKKRRQPFALIPFLASAATVVFFV